MNRQHQTETGKEKTRYTEDNMKRALRDGSKVAAIVGHDVGFYRCPVCGCLHMTKLVDGKDVEFMVDANRNMKKVERKNLTYRIKMVTL